MMRVLMLCCMVLLISCTSYTYKDHTIEPLFTNCLDDLERKNKGTSFDYSNYLSCYDGLKINFFFVEDFKMNINIQPSKNIFPFGGETDWFNLHQFDYGLVKDKLPSDCCLASNDVILKLCNFSVQSTNFTNPNPHMVVGNPLSLQQSPSHITDSVHTTQISTRSNFLTEANVDINKIIDTLSLPCGLKYTFYENSYAVFKSVIVENVEMEPDMSTRDTLIGITLKIGDLKSYTRTD